MRLETFRGSGLRCLWPAWAYGRAPAWLIYLCLTDLGGLGYKRKHQNLICNNKVTYWLWSLRPCEVTIVEIFDM